MDLRQGGGASIPDATCAKPARDRLHDRAQFARTATWERLAPSARARKIQRRWPAARKALARVRMIQFAAMALGKIDGVAAPVAAIASAARTEALLDRRRLATEGLWQPARLYGDVLVHRGGRDGASFFQPRQLLERRCSKLRIRLRRVLRCAHRPPTREFLQELSLNSPARQ